MADKEIMLPKETKKGIFLQRTIPVVTFYLEDFLFGIYAEKVMEINKDLDITPVPLSAPYILGIMNLRGQIITVIDLAKKINFKIETQPRLNLIVKNQDEAVSFLIERISDILEIPEAKLEDPPEKIEGLDKEYVDKIYQLPDKLIAILKVEKLFEN
ncbi:MAG: chemotaxis protein CheW [Caldimicrobium sp.]|jgi:purine-binding chemotaxis protein CheW